MDSSDISSDLSSQQLVVNQLREKLQQNESLLKGRESEIEKLQTKFNKIKFLQKSKTATSSSETTPTRRTTPSDDHKMTTSSDMTESTNRGKYLLLKKQLDESRALLQRQTSENQLMRHELQVLRDRQVKYEEEGVDKDVEVITVNESQADTEGLNEMFAQIVYKDTKMMEMNQKICDLETRIMDLQENLREQNEVLQARNRAIKVLLSQQQTSGAIGVISFDEVVQREEEKERIERLKERVCELEMEKGSLQLRVMELEGTNGSKPPVIDIELERDSLRAEKDELKIRFDELIAKYDSLDLQKDKLINDKERVGNELKRYKELNNNLTKDKDKCMTELEQLSHTIAVNEQNFNSVNNELIELKSNWSEKDREILSVRQQLSDLAQKSKNVIVEKDSVINDLKQQLDQISEDIPIEKDRMIEALTKELEDLKNQNWSLVNNNEEVKEDNNQLNRRLSAIQSDYGQFNNDIQVLRNEKLELISQLDASASQVSQLAQQLSEISVQNESNISELIVEMENLKEINANDSEKVIQLEQSIRSMDEEMSALLTNKDSLVEQMETMRSELEKERQIKCESIERLDRIQSEMFAENELIDEKDKQIDELRREVENYKRFVSEEQTKIDDYNRERDESKSFIEELEAVLEEKNISFNELESSYTQNYSLLNQKIVLIDEMNEEKRVLESKFEEAKVKNQTLANQMENLIKVVEIESQEKDKLRQSLESLQKENFNENDLIREKDERIDSLQKEVRKQVEDMQEIEELLTEKQNEIEILNKDVLLAQKDRTEFENMSSDLQRRLEDKDSKTSEELNGLLRQIEDLNEENDSNKNEIKVLNQKLSDDLKAAKERLDLSEEESLSTIAELRKQLESQEIRLNEAMSELLSKSDENTDTNLLYNEIQVLREANDSLQRQNQLLQNDYQNSASHLNASVNEYKSLLDESRIQIDRLEAEKLSAIQETNQVNQVLENERENQTLVVNENRELRQCVARLESDLQTAHSQNEYEYESVQNDRINHLNQTIDNLQKHNSEMSTKLEQMSRLSEDMQTSSAKQMEEMTQTANSEKTHLSQRLIDLQNTVESLNAEKQSFEYGFYDMQNKCQDLDRLLQTKNVEIENSKQFEELYQKLTKSVTNLKEEKEHLLSVLSEKEKLLEVESKERQQLSDEKQQMEQTFANTETNNTQIHALNELNSNLQKTCEVFVVKEDKLKTTIAALEQEMEDSKRLLSEVEVKNSETEYELEILKRNYSIEMESYGAQVQEREQLIDKLQTNSEKMKRKLDKRQLLMKEMTEKEAYFQSKLDEAQGLVKYEQMQRQTAIDSRIFDLQQQLSDKDSHLLNEVMSLKAEKSNFVALEQELRRKIRELEESQSRGMGGVEDKEREIHNYRSHIDSLASQLEAERIEKIRLQELYQSSGDQKSDQLNQMMCQMENERQTQLTQKHELELKCKKFAAKFKVKEREVIALEEKLRIAKENESKNVNEEDVIESNKRVEELTKRVEDLQFTASNLDAALQTERQKRRQLETEKQSFWSQSTKASDSRTHMETDDSTASSSSFSLLIEEGNGDKSGLSSAKRFLTKQKHYLLRGPPNAKYRRVVVVMYLVVIHMVLLKACLF